MRISFFFSCLLVTTVFTSAPVFAQCVGTPSLPPATLPTGNIVATFTAPNGVELDGVCLAPPGGVIQGGVFAAVGLNNQLILFSDGAPGIEVVSAGSLTSYPITGTELRCAGLDCKTDKNGNTLVQSFAITDVAVGGVIGGLFHENILPAPPVAAAGVGAASPDGAIVTFSLLVETALPSVEVHFNGVATSFPIAGLLPGTSLAYSTGPAGGFVAFDATNAYQVSGGVMTTIPLGSTYMSVTIIATGIRVNLVAGGPTDIFLGAGVQVVPFGECSVPGTPAIAYAIAPAAPWILAANPAWPPSVINCPTDVPTLSEIGLIVLTLTLVGVAIPVLRKRNRARVLS